MADNLPPLTCHCGRKWKHTAYGWASSGDSELAIEQARAALLKELEGQEK